MSTFRRYGPDVLCVERVVREGRYEGTEDP